ncbi:MAG: cell division protein FtsH, partial [Candidatus Promineifilaceae bacterium]
QQVTKMARAMVTQYGMSDEMGPRVYGDKQELVFLGREISEQRDYSDAIAEQIDTEVRQIIDAEHDRAKKILTENRDVLDLIANKLLEVETLEAEEFVALIEGLEPPETPAAIGKTAESSSQEVGEQVDWEPPSTLELPPAPSPA